MAVNYSELRHWNYAPLTAATADGRPLPVGTQNRVPIQSLTTRLKEWGSIRTKLIIVPGYTPVKAKKPVRMHPTEFQRLQMAVAMRERLVDAFIAVSGGNVHPDGTPYNEAWEMKQALIGKLGVPEDRVILEPYARHSTTNLRNVGRLMLALGMDEATVVTTGGQGFYFGHPDLSTFNLRCRKVLGYELGTLIAENEPPTHITYRPDDAIKQRGDDPQDP
ncbi:MAG: YdcF family protein [Alphaproteobacteria bacterium]|nr:YdcF family protein [Alphaproteobacteria bacterium]